MLPVSQRFVAALAEPHRVTVGVRVTPAEGQPPPALAQPISGALRMDRDARVRRQGNVVVGFELNANLDYVRRLPYGGYVQLERGVLFADGTMERPIIATLRVDTVSWSELEGQATLELSDRMAQIQEEPFTTPWAPNGMHPSDAIVAAVQQVFGSTIAYHVSTTPSAEPTLVDVVYDEDRAQAIGDLASSVGAGCYFDAAGDFVLAPSPPNPASVTPVWEFEVGARGTLEEVQENLDRSAVRNGVAVRGQAAADTPPIYALAIDADAASPTRWGGPFGKVALIVNSTSVQSQAQANSTAASLLNLRLGLARTVTLRGVPMPALEPDDVIMACYPDGREEPMRVNNVGLPLDPAGSMDVGVTGHYTPNVLTRRRRGRRHAVAVFGGAQAWQRELRGAKLVPT